MAQVPSPGQRTDHPLSHMTQPPPGSSNGAQEAKRGMFARLRARFGRSSQPTAPAQPYPPYGYAPPPPQGFAPEGHPVQYGYGPPQHQGYPPAEAYAPYGYAPAPPQGFAPGYGPYAPVAPTHEAPYAPVHEAPYVPAPVAPQAPPPPGPGFTAPITPPAPVAPEPLAVPEAPEPPPQPPREELITAALASLAMRDLTLVDSLLAIVEDLEDTTEDPDLLENLFKIDNLATRMRRNGENLLVLAGQDSGDPQMEPVPLLDVSRAAISEISDYERVRLGRLPALFIAGHVSDDISHLLAELLDNATAKSPDHAQVVISAQAMAEGQLLLTVEDEGIGVPDAQLNTINERLGGSPVLDEDAIRHMGLYVVSRIAHRHGLQVQLQARAFRGISAHIVVPAELLSETGPAPEAEPAAQAASTVVAPPLSPPPLRVQHNGGEAAALTAAGLPRRGANRPTTPMPELPAEPEAEPVRTEDPESRAERIRADLEGFLEGERAATKDE